MKRALSSPRLAGFILLLSGTGCYFGGEGKSSDANPEKDLDGNKPLIDAAGKPDAFVPLDVNYQFLSETGLYSDFAARTLSPGVMRFTPEFKLWSDAAEKERFIWLPPDTQIDTSDMDRWRFPTGTKVWKTFSNPENGLLETRFIMRLGPNPEQLFMTSFVWNASETAAVRAPGGVGIARDDVTICPDRPTVENPTPNCHYVPPEDECIRCHDGQPHNVLGFSALQLAHAGSETNLDDLNNMHLLTDPPVKTPTIPGTGVARDALGYMHANCGHCHNRDLDQGETCYGLTGFEARVFVENETVDTSSAYLSSVNVPINYWSAQNGNIFAIKCRITPGIAEKSAVWKRMSIRDGWFRPHAQMPPEFTAEIDTEGATLIQNWINAMTEMPAPLCKL